MYRTYFTPNPNELSPTGLLEVPVLGQEPATHNAAYADLIRRAIDASQMDSPQARVMEAFYRGHGIPRDLMNDVESTVGELDVAWPVQLSLYEAAKEDPESAPFTAQDVEELGFALETDARDGITYLSGDGLVLDSRTGDFETPLLLGVNGLLPLDKEDQVLARHLDAESYTFQAELVWRPGEGGELEPVVLADREHIALGSVAANGAFEHVFTVLAHEHPARQPIPLRRATK